MSQPVRHIFVDMDGVLADFVTAAVHLHCRPEVLQGWPLGEFECPRVLEISPSAFWNRIDDVGDSFWSGLEPFPWMRDLLERLREIAPVTIASSPSYDPASLAGKVRWLQTHLGRKFRDYLIGPPKYLLARADTVLVDDSDRNINRFREHGGIGVLFPQNWNSNHPHTADRLQFVVDALTQPSSRPESGSPS